jgi:hypothetical protein
VSSTSRHSIASNPFLSFPTTNFAKIFSIFYTPVFSLCGFFYYAWPTQALKVSHYALKGPLGISCQRISKNLSQRSRTSYTIFLFMYLSLNHFLTLVGVNSSFILVIE